MNELVVIPKSELQALIQSAVQSVVSPASPSTQNEFLKKDEAAARFGLTKREIDELIRSRKIPYIFISQKNILIDPVELKAYLIQNYGVKAS